MVKSARIGLAVNWALARQPHSIRFPGGSPRLTFKGDKTGGRPVPAKEECR
jgi:hypothetical protein